MSGALQAVFQNQRSFIVVPIVGSALGGGYFAGQISTTGNGIADYNLVVGPVSSAENGAKLWKTSDTDTTGTSSIIDGPANSTAMNNASHPAAQFCKAVTAGGFSDWYMPAKNEIEIIYYNLKPTTAFSVLDPYNNVNAVPPRNAAYTSLVPGQTSATDFQSGGSQAFTATYYWSSTQKTAVYAWAESFYVGGMDYKYKSNPTRRVRAVRRVAV